MRTRRRTRIAGDALRTFAVVAFFVFVGAVIGMALLMIVLGQGFGP